MTELEARTARQKESLRQININRALTILAIKMGKYSDMCRAYVHVKDNGRWVWANPELKWNFDSEMMPLLERICGSSLGENPDQPNHPIQKWKA